MTSNDQIYARLERIENKIDKLTERVREVEMEGASRKGAKAAIVGVVGIVTGSGLWAWLSEYFGAGGK